MSDDIQKIIEFNENDPPPLSDNEEEGESSEVNDPHPSEEEEDQYDDEDGGDEIGEPVADDNSITQLRAHTDDVLRVSASESTRWLASGSKDNSVLVWDLDSPNALTPYMSILEHDESVDFIAFNSKSRLLASGDISGKIICTDLFNKSQLCAIDECSGLGWLFWHPIADILFAGSSDGLIWMWLIGTEGVTQSKIYASGTATPCSAAKLLPPENKILLAVYEDAQVRFWDLKEAIIIATPIKLDSPCLQLAAMDVHPTQNLAAIGCYDGGIAIINTNSYKLMETLGKIVENKDLSASTEDTDNELPSPNGIEVVKFAPSGYNWLAVATTGGLLTIYDMDTGNARHTCEHDEAVTNCIWRSAASRLFIFSACFDGAVRAWDAKSGEPALLLSGGGPANGIFDFCLVKKGDEAKIFTACPMGIIRVFNC